MAQMTIGRPIGAEPQIQGITS